MVNFTQNLEKVMERLPKGAFLTVKSDNEVNTMTIGWGSIGFIWRKPVFEILVRKSRHTYELIEKAKEFTVTVPLDDEMKEKLAFCGSKSGRDVDKIKECNLNLKEGKKVSTPVIDNCGMAYECKIIYKRGMDLSLVDEDFKNSFYKDGNEHVIYYGEIVDCYLNK